MVLLYLLYSESPCGILPQNALDQVYELGVCDVRVVRLVFYDRSLKVLDGDRVKRISPCSDLVEDHPACPQVCRLPVVLRTLAYFRTQVKACARFRIEHIISVFKHLANTEIRQHYRTILIQQNVLRLDISMDNMRDIMAVFNCIY